MEPESGTSGRRRKSSLAFPSHPETERGGFIQFMEDSGTADIFLGIFQGLFDEKQKPEDPIAWILKYLRERAPSQQNELDSIIETLKKEILQTANEIESLKAKVRKENSLESNWCEGAQLEEDFLTAGNDGRWQIKPDPLYRSSLPIWTLPPNVCTDDDNQAQCYSEKAQSNGSESKIPFNPQNENEEGEDAGGDDTERHPNSLDKSTETSAQPSDYENEEDGEEYGTETERRATNRKIYKVYDPTFFDRCLPLNFWEGSFGLEKEESEDEEEAREFTAKNYKFKVLQETSWLPERDLKKLEKTLLETHSVVASSVDSLNDPRQVGNNGVEPGLSQYEWHQKDYGPIYLRQSQAPFASAPSKQNPTSKKN